MKVPFFVSLCVTVQRVQGAVVRGQDEIRTDNCTLITAPTIYCRGPYGNKE